MPSKRAGNQGQPAEGGKNGGDPSDRDAANKAGTPAAGGLPQKDSPPPDTEVENAARAAGLALRRLQQQLDRGEVDQKLLDELGWTREELESFVKRMQSQLADRELNQQQPEKSLSQKSFDEMLRSLGINESGTSRDGNSARDRQRQDTTIRQSTPPARYRNSFEAYQRSLSRKP
jgi:hypothetical protein